MAGAEARLCFVHTPSVAFRAHRDYLHSTTLYKELLAGAEAAGVIPDGALELRARRRVRCQPELHYSRSPIAASTDAPAIFTVQANGVVWHGAVVESELPIAEHKHYDETPIASREVIEATSIHVAGPIGLHPNQDITALPLLLHPRPLKILVARKG